MCGDGPLARPDGRSPVTTRILYPDNVPELPEVETIARGLNTRVAGDTVESVWIGSRKQPLKSSATVIASTLEGKRIVQVHRAGKHIVFDLESAAPALRKQKKKAATVSQHHNAPTA